MFSSLDDYLSARPLGDPILIPERDLPANVIPFRRGRTGVDAGETDQEVIFRDGLQLLADLATLSFAWTQLSQVLTELHEQLMGLS